MAFSVKCHKKTQNILNVVAAMLVFPVPILEFIGFLICCVMTLFFSFGRDGFVWELLAYGLCLLASAALGVVSIVLVIADHCRVRWLMLIWSISCLALVACYVLSMKMSKQSLQTESLLLSIYVGLSPILLTVWTFISNSTLQKRLE